MKIYDATFSTDDPNGLKPGEPVATWKVGQTVLPGCEPFYWSGSGFGSGATAKEYTAERIMAWQAEVNKVPGRLGAHNLEPCAATISDYSLKRLFTAAQGTRQTTFGMNWGTHRLTDRNTGNKFNALVSEFAGKIVRIDDAIIRRYQSIKNVVGHLEYMTIEAQNDQQRYFDLYCQHHRRWSEFYAHMFPGKKRLTWLCPAWTHDPNLVPPNVDRPKPDPTGYWPMTKNECDTFRNDAANAGNDLVIWGPFYACRGFFGL